MRNLTAEELELVSGGIQTVTVYGNPDSYDPPHTDIWSTYGGGEGGGGGGGNVNVGINFDVNKFFDQTKGILANDPVQKQLDKNEDRLRQQGVNSDYLHRDGVYNGKNYYTSYNVGPTYQRMFIDLDGDTKVDLEIAPAPGGGFSYDLDGDGQADGQF